MHCHYCGNTKPDVSVWSKALKKLIWFHEKCYNFYVIDGGLDL